MALAGAQVSMGRVRYLVLHLPAFRLERCGYEAGQLAGLLTEQKSAMRLVALTPAARAEGLFEGMTASEARAQCPAIQLDVLDPQAEHVDRQALLHRLDALSDRVLPLWQADVLVEVAGTAHLFGGEHALVVQARELAEALGHCCRAAIADDPLAASAIASWGAPDTVVPVGEGARALADLPLVALRPTDSLAQALRAVGIDRVRQLAGLDPASVAGRYGAEGARLQQVARGRVASGVLWGQTTLDDVVEVAPLGGPTRLLAPIYFLLPGMLARMSQRLAAQDRMAVRLALRFVLDRGPSSLLRLRTGRPTRDPEHLETLLRARLERVKLEAPVVEIQLEVEEATTDPGWQPGLLDRSSAAEDLPELLARLTDALGEQAVLSPVPVDTWRPERAWAGRPFVPGQPLPRPPAPRSQRNKVDPVERLYRRERGPSRPRPALLLPAPERVELQLSARGAPGRVRLDGVWRGVQRADGPEQLEGEWWHNDGGFRRAYWVVDVDGRCAWLYRDDRGGWFVHGWFD